MSSPAVIPFININIDYQEVSGIEHRRGDSPTFLSRRVDNWHPVCALLHRIHHRSSPGMTALLSSGRIFLFFFMEKSEEGAHGRESSDSATACTFSFDATDGSRCAEKCSDCKASNEANLNARLVKSKGRSGLPVQGTTGPFITPFYNETIPSAFYRSRDSVVYTADRVSYPLGKKEKHCLVISCFNCVLCIERAIGKNQAEIISQEKTHKKFNKNLTI